MVNIPEYPPGNPVKEIRDELEGLKDPKLKRIATKLIKAAVTNLPWIGAFFDVWLTIREEDKGQNRHNELIGEWLIVHQEKIAELEASLREIMERTRNLGEEVDKRLESDSYLALVTKAYKAWDHAETKEKKELLRKLLTKAAASKLCDDDILSLFIQWIDQYHEIHFKVIKVIYANEGITRAEIWQEIYGEFPTDDSAEADLFKLLIHELSLGMVIRQERATEGGKYLRQSSRSKSSSPYMKSPFDDEKGYVLTGLGRQFVHYVLDDVVPRLTEPVPGNA